MVRDGHTSSSARVFRVDLPNGFYTVSAILGDTAAQDSVSIRVLGQAGEGVEKVFSTARQYTRVTFDATVTDGVLRLEISRTGTRRTWTLNALEIRGRVSVQTLPAAGANSAGNFDIGKWVEQTVSVPPGTYTIYPTIGEINASDANPLLSLRQVVVTEGQPLRFSVRHSAVGSGQVVIESLDGQHRYAMPVAFDYPSLRRFDFNARSTSATAADFIGVLATTRYSSSLGYGWLSSATGTQRSGAVATPSELFNDSHSSSASRVFQVGVKAGQAYDLRLYFGDTLSAASAEFSIDGGPYQRVNTLAGEHRWIDTRVVASGSVMKIIYRKASSRYWYAPGLEIGLAGSLPANPLRLATALSAIPDQSDRSIRPGAAGMLTPQLLVPIVLEAYARWDAAGLTEEQSQRLRDARVEVVDLGPSATLAMAFTDYVLIDDDALGFGWFIDPTPGTDDEYAAAIATGTDKDDIAERIDLLTVVMHEMGHLLGLPDLDPAAASDTSDLMMSSLNAGVRRVPVRLQAGSVDSPSGLPNLAPQISASGVAYGWTGSLSGFVSPLAVALDRRGRAAQLAVESQSRRDVTRIEPRSRDAFFRELDEDELREVFETGIESLLRSSLPRR